MSRLASFVFVLLGALCAVCNAQYSSGATSASDSSASSTASSSGPGPALTHTITVGNGAFRYQPNVTYASPGDLIVFAFYPLNHSVTRGEYTNSGACGGSVPCNPCVPYETIHNGSTAGFSSGIKYVETFPSSPPTWNLTINDTQPIWLYCNAPGSCWPNGMVAVINPGPSDSFSAQENAALNAQFELSPGQPWPAEGEGGGGGGSSGEYGSGNSTNHGSSGLSGGAIAGIVIGCVALVFLLGAVFYLIGRTHSLSAMFQSHRASTATAGAGVPDSTAGDDSTMYASDAMGPPPAEKRYDPQRMSAISESGPRASRGASPAPTPQPQTGQFFVGYNRQTGAPEFASEVPAVERAELESPSGDEFANRTTVSTFGDRLSGSQKT